MSIFFHSRATSPGTFSSPAVHEHVAGAGLVFEGHELLVTQLLAASVKAVRAVDAP